jgi:hypothetical protein
VARAPIGEACSTSPLPPGVLIVEQSLGDAMPSPRERRQLADRDDRELVERAARWLRHDPARHEHAGLEDDDPAGALADLLDALAAGVPALDRAVRWQARQSARVLLGETMESPGIRRTRYR